MKKIINPKLSIITINYNNKEGLSRTIKSVLDQTWQEFEYLIIDGGSNDGSQGVIDSNSNFLTHRVSEKDKGIYHAMNKGIKASSGTYLLFLNSGDVLRGPSVLEDANHQLQHFDIVYTDLELINNGKSRIDSFPDILSFKQVAYNYLPHPSSFIKRELFEKYGLYDESLKICSDWKFFTEVICKHNATHKHIEGVLTCFFENGISASPENREIITKERHEYLSSNFSAFTSDYDEFDRLNKKFNKIHKSMIVKLLKKLRLL